ncbi:MAG: hypothetical protein GY856_22985 [bacterium]|nr:hypothetical protein [bacterium]
MRRYTLGVVVTTLALLLLCASMAAADEEPTRLSGWFTVIWGDPPADSDGPSPQLFVLTDEAGHTTELVLSDAVRRSRGGALQWNGRRVEVTLASRQERSVEIRDERPRAAAIRSLPAADREADSGRLSGSQPWISILCKFSDVGSEPQNLGFFQGMYANSPGGLDHYWREVSYDAIDIAGSTAVNWVTLPHPQTYYIPTPGAGCFGPNPANLNALFADCTAAADPLVDFSNGGSPFQGINLMFNSDLDGCAWGGGRYASLDGVTKVWRTTWEPPWGYANEGVMAHEMGHGFGLPHSNNSDGDSSPYDSPWDVMSSATGHSVWDPTYGALGKHTISYHKDLLGWIPSGEIFEVTTAGIYTITIDHLALASTGNYRMARIPIDAFTYYTVEVRDLVGNYDGALPGNAVIIHDVDPSRYEDAWLIDADDPPAGYSNNEGVMWRVGEAFVDTEHSIAVYVQAATADGFEVEITFGDDVVFSDGFESGSISSWNVAEGDLRTAR